MHYRLKRFVDKLSDTIDRAQGDETLILEEGGEHMKELVAQDDWLEDEHAKPHPDFYQQYLLYCCPNERFSVVSFVWGPGQKTPIHDHTVWGIIGMLRGSELEEEYEISKIGEPLKKTGSAVLTPGTVGKVSPTIGDVHLVANAYDDQVSISIHVYGGDIGKIQRHVFDMSTSQAKDFISGYANI